MNADELRALDVRVAEARGYRTELQQWKTLTGEECAQWSYLRPDFAEFPQADYAWAELPHYSTDPAASRVLLDEMAAAGDVDIAHEVGLPWGVQMRAADEVWFDEAPTLDAAICLAWLAWRESSKG